MEKKGVLLNQSSHMHYNDHLAPISVIMGMPLLFEEDKDLERCLRYYPGLIAEKVEYADFNPEYLIQHYDVLFMSDLWDRDVFRAKFSQLSLKWKKQLRNVHIPHGFSDKGFYLKKAAKEDITLVYGQNMLDLFKSEGVYEELNQYVLTGNYRYTYFKMHEDHFLRIIDEEVISKFSKKQTTILYAPTWMDLEESSTFFEAHAHVLEALPEDFNLIVKLHPQLELDDTGKYYQILGRYAGKSNLQFLTNYPLIYPLLARSDLYISDMSSIGYDYLVFDKPMFFLNKYNRDPKKDRRFLLAQAGVNVRKSEFDQLFPLIESHLEKDVGKFTQLRNDLNIYTFGKEISFSELKQAIIAAYNQPPKK
jgi:hypothetical protein